MVELSFDLVRNSLMVSPRLDLKSMVNHYVLLLLRILCLLCLLGHSLWWMRVSACQGLLLADLYTDLVLLTFSLVVIVGSTDFVASAICSVAIL